MIGQLARSKMKRHSWQHRVRSLLHGTQLKHKLVLLSSWRISSTTGIRPTTSQRLAWNSLRLASGPLRLRRETPRRKLFNS